MEHKLFDNSDNPVKPNTLYYNDWGIYYYKINKHHNAYVQYDLATGIRNSYIMEFKTFLTIKPIIF